MSPAEARRRRSRSHGHVRPSRGRRRAFFAIGFLLAATGAGWLVAHYLMRAADAELPHPAEPWWLRAHGASVLAFLILFGSLLPTHVVPAWRRGRDLASGVALVTLIALLTVTGYGLYYAGSEAVRALTSRIHWVAGLASLAAVAWHLLSARISRRRTNAAPQRRRLATR
jgi:hypothetical protein